MRRIKKTQELNSLELVFKTIFEQSPMSTQIFSPIGVPLFANKAWEKMWGTKHDKIKGRYNIFNDKQLKDKGVMKDIRAGFSGKTVRIPAIRYEPDKTIKNISKVPFRWTGALIYPVKDKQSKIMYIVVQHEDITEKKKAEDALKESEHHYRTLVELSPEPMGIITKDKIVYVNKAGLKMMRARSTRDLIGKPPLTFVHPDYKKIAAQRIAQVLIKRQPVELIEEKFMALDGQTIDVEVMSIPTVYKGEPADQLVVRDITEHKRIDRLKDIFIAMASHELRTPITTLKVFSQLIEKYCQKYKDNKLQTYFDKMAGQIDSLEDLIKDFLDVSKIETGKLDYKMEFFNLQKLMKEMVNDFRLTTTYFLINFKGPEKLIVKGDKYRVGQVMTNLLSNAIKYSTQEKSIDVVILKKDSEAQISVRDRGIGIPRKQQLKIFNKFFRVEYNNGKAVSGLGLGLYISNEIVKRQGGKMWVKSKEGKGSTFFFTLPLKV